jgi:hypothetical protein
MAASRAPVFNALLFGAACGDVRLSLREAAPPRGVVLPAFAFTVVVLAGRSVAAGATVFDFAFFTSARIN